ncbi:hypothetical protein GPUN_1034 [Glaciecola punicea ACAM 611]|uniref:Uncharacterized protein n=1 Tax=Glaciecola punicea ACAM 611 TaxID=1121923 RepID=H5TA38_9ALTE|nr:hypothetical protein GPUN_1034 [Glaciecola punicea ACAM 611]
MSSILLILYFHHVALHTLCQFTQIIDTCFCKIIVDIKYYTRILQHT